MLCETFNLIRIIGTPFSDSVSEVSYSVLEDIYEKAFKDRVALLYLATHRKPDWTPKLERLYSTLNKRRHETLCVVTDLAKLLNKFCPDEYAIFKSFKPYPATPNDTDVIIFADNLKLSDIIEYLYSNGYFFHEWAPMQTTICDPRGKGKTGKGKKGGIYYIDIYSDISTDYFKYLDKRSIRPHTYSIQVNGTEVKTVRKEVELAIILFHNVFPERTFQLEHLYVPLYYLREDDFDLDVLIEFAEKQHLVHAISTNLTIVEYLHKKVFHFVPVCIHRLLDYLGRNSYEVKRFKVVGEETPYLFSPKTFWITFFHKNRDREALTSLCTQALHMLNPIFFINVAKSLKNRLSEKGTYHLE